MYFCKNSVYAQSVYITPRRHFKTCQHSLKMILIPCKIFHQPRRRAIYPAVQLVNEFTRSRAFALSLAIHFMSRAAREQVLSLAGIRPIQSVKNRIARASTAILFFPSWHGSLYFRKLCHIEIIISTFLFHQFFRTSLFQDAAFVNDENAVRILNR